MALSMGLAPSVGVWERRNDLLFHQYSVFSVIFLLALLPVSHKKLGSRKESIVELGKEYFISG